jgi:hypothetical protein
VRSEVHVIDYRALRVIMTKIARTVNLRRVLSNRQISLLLTLFDNDPRFANLVNE